MSMNACSKFKITPFFASISNRIQCFSCGSEIDKDKPTQPRSTALTKNAMPNKPADSTCFVSSANAKYMEYLFSKWVNNSESVDKSWQVFFSAVMVEHRKKQDLEEASREHCLTEQISAGNTSAQERIMNANQAGLAAKPHTPCSGRREGSLADIASILALQASIEDAKTASVETIPDAAKPKVADMRPTVEKSSIGESIYLFSKAGNDVNVETKTNAMAETLKNTYTRNVCIDSVMQSLDVAMTAVTVTDSNAVKVTPLIGKAKAITANECVGQEANLTPDKIQSSVDTKTVWANAVKQSLDVAMPAVTVAVTDSNAAIATPLIGNSGELAEKECSGQKPKRDILAEEVKQNVDVAMPAITVTDSNVTIANPSIGKVEDLKGLECVGQEANLTHDKIQSSVDTKTIWANAVKQRLNVAMPAVTVTDSNAAKVTPSMGKAEELKWHEFVGQKANLTPDKIHCIVDTKTIWANAVKRSLDVAMPAVTVIVTDSNAALATPSIGKAGELTEKERGDQKPTRNFLADKVKQSLDVAMPAVAVTDSNAKAGDVANITEIVKKAANDIVANLIGTGGDGQEMANLSRDKVQTIIETIRAHIPPQLDTVASSAMSCQSGATKGMGSINILKQLCDEMIAIMRANLPNKSMSEVGSNGPKVFSLAAEKELNLSSPEQMVATGCDSAKDVTNSDKP